MVAVAAAGAAVAREGGNFPEASTAGAINNHLPSPVEACAAVDTGACLDPVSADWFGAALGSPSPDAAAVRTPDAGLAALLPCPVSTPAAPGASPAAGPAAPVGSPEKHGLQHDRAPKIVKIVATTQY